MHPAHLNWAVPITRGASAVQSAFVYVHMHANQACPMTFLDLVALRRSERVLLLILMSVLLEFFPCAYNSKLKGKNHIVS
jgi:hypothetical protein